VKAPRSLVCPVSRPVPVGVSELPQGRQIAVLRDLRDGGEIDLIGAGEVGRAAERIDNL
jgi:hypothetical protein